jgi:hypothetical protein
MRAVIYPEGLHAMTIADKIEDHQARCQPHVLRLRMIARDEAGTALTWQAVTEVIQATGAILAEAEASDSDARAAAGAGPGAATFLGVRLNRLAVAASDAITAAGEGDSGQLRRHLHRFEVLTSAIWTVQQAVSGPDPGRHR